MSTIDTRGQLCPMPIILFKKALNDAAAGSILSVLTDNETACQNLTSYMAELGLPHSVHQEEGYRRIEVQILTAQTVMMGGESCSPQSVSGNAPYTLLLTSTEMGCGDSDLGQILMRAYLNTIKEVTPLPRQIILYNKGVQLCRRDTDTARALAELKDLGVDILCCGTCVDYFGIKEELSVGRIGNMMAIAEVLAHNPHLVRP